MHSAYPPTANAADQSALYTTLQPKLLATLKRSVHAPHEVLEDACSFAWLQFVINQPDADGNPFAWLCKTAEREAWRLYARELRELPLATERASDADADAVLGLGLPTCAAATIDEQLQLRATVSEIARLSPRRRVAFAAHVVGFTHKEIAEATGWTMRAVDGLVRKSRVRLRDRHGS